MSGGYGNRDKRALFFSVNQGKFKFRESKTADYQFCDSVWGRFAGTEVRWKEGSDSFAGHESLLITIAATDEATNTVTELKLDAFFPSTWAKMFVDYMAELNLGEEIQVSTWGSNEAGNKSSFCKVERMIEGVSAPVTRRTDAPKLDKEALARAQHGKSAKDAAAIKEEFQRRTSEDVAKWCLAILEPHPTFRKAERDDDDDLGDDPEDQSQPEGTTGQEGRSNESSHGSAAMAGRQTHAHIPQDAGVKSPLPDGPTMAFDHEIAFRPQAEVFEMSISNTQRDMLEKKTVELFEGSRMRAEVVGAAVLKDMGLESKPFMSWDKARMGLYLAFLIHAPAASLSKAMVAANPGASVAPGEEDPFA